MSNALLKVEDLSVEVPSESGALQILDSVSFSLESGRTMGLVGESGSGKSLTANSVIGMIGTARVANGSIKYHDKEIVGLAETKLRELRGHKISMVFQEPMTALDPTFTVGEQIAETIREHKKVSKSEAWARAVQLLGQVGIPSPEERAKDYPHNFSGGMRQRVVIAIALSCDPDILLADEPTTALDVTTQAEILALLKDLQKESDLGIVFVSHDLGVIADISDDVSVMYAGQIVEQGDVYEVFDHPRHQYTKALMDCIPQGPDHELLPIPGTVPEFSKLPPGCPFSDRCPAAQPDCQQGPIPFFDFGGSHIARCLHPVQNGE